MKFAARVLRLRRLGNIAVKNAGWKQLPRTKKKKDNYVGTAKTQMRICVAGLVKK